MAVLVIAFDCDAMRNIASCVIGRLRFAVEPADRLLVDGLTVAQHERDRAGDTTGVDVLLQEAIDAREPVGRNAVRRPDDGGSTRACAWSDETPSITRTLPESARRRTRRARAFGAKTSESVIEGFDWNRPVWNANVGGAPIMARRPRGDQQWRPFSTPR